MKVTELLKYIDDDTTIVFSHLDAQNIGYEYIAKCVPTEIRHQSVCGITAEDSKLSVIVC